jgi:PhnB protein
MKSQVKPIPKGYHSVTPYLVVDNADAAIRFYLKAFGAVEVFRMDGPDHKVAHAEIQIGDSRVMLSDEVPAMKIHSPKALGGSPVSLMIYLEDVDHVFKAAVKAGATVMRPVEDMFYGDRSGTVTDPFGHTWTLSTHKEDLTAEEIQHRAMAVH